MFFYIVTFHKNGLELRKMKNNYPKGMFTQVLLPHIVPSCGLYYKCITIVIDAPSVVSKWHSKL